MNNLKYDDVIQSRSMETNNITSQCNEVLSLQAALPAPTWDGVYDAVDEHTRCPQKLLMDSLIVGSEDCLKLNVYSPTAPREELYPVMVYIHGGVFLEGSVSTLLYGADFFLDHEVIFVSISYRLNVEGFLCLGIREAPGNAGLKDQVAALRWIQKNIKAFGGDPDKVTLFGESAGAVSVSHLMLSPVTEGLFHRAILQSGSSTVPWGIQHDPIRTASDLAREFGYYGNDPYEIYQTLENKSIRELILGIKYLKNRNLITSQTLFVPCVEKDLPGVEAVIRTHPINAIRSGNYTKLPMIRGFNNKEGIYLVYRDYGFFVEDVDPHTVIQSDLRFLSDKSRNETAEEILKLYFSNESKDKTMGMVDLYSDLHIKFPIILETSLFAETNEEPMFFYVFAHDGFVNLAKFVSLFLFSEGASHGDELFYLFKSYILMLPFQNFEKKMVERMVTLWTNFAKYSDPTPSTSELLPMRWLPSRESNPAALVIDRELTTAPLWDDTHFDFWNKTYTKYRRRNYGF